MSKRIIREARDPMVPPDQTPDQFLDTYVNPTDTLPGRFEPEGLTPDDQEGEHQFFLRDGVTPYRTADDANYDVWDAQVGGWFLQNDIDPDRLWPSTANEIGGLIGDSSKLDVPRKGITPWVDDGELRESESVGDFTTSQDFLSDSPTTNNAGPDSDSQDESTTDIDGSMTENEIRDTNGTAIDLPFESAGPARMKYKDTGQTVWVPPPGWREGAPPIDPWLAERFGAEPDLGAPGPTADSSPQTDTLVEPEHEVADVSDTLPPTRDVS